MRVLLFILVLVFTVSAQDHLADAARLANKGQYQKALQKYRSAQREAKGPDAASVIHYNTGVCLYHLGHSSEAVAELTKAIELRGGKYQQAWYALGMSETALGSTAKAREAFSKAVELNKKDAEAWFDLGMVLIQEKAFDAAKDAFEKAAELGSVGTPHAHNNIGVIYALNGDIESAILKFELSGSVEAVENLKYCRTRKLELAENRSAMLKFAQKRND